MQIRENVSSLSEEPVWSLIESLQVSSFTYKKIVNTEAIEEYTDELTGELIPAQKETYIPYPEGIQVMIEPSSLENIYPEGVVTGSDGTKYYRSELVTAFLVQAIKEVRAELSGRIDSLETLIK
jgi:hypothetical protein